MSGRKPLTAAERAPEPPELQFRAALKSRDIVPPADLVADGKVHRCDAVGRGGKADAAYLLHLDSVPAGGFNNHRDGIGWENWRADIGRQLTPSEKQKDRRRARAVRVARQPEDARRQGGAAARAKAILAETQPCTAHAYLEQKGVQPHGLQVSRGNLVVPVHDIDGQVHSLQFIHSDGGKKFLRDGRVKGCYFAIGEFGAVICIAEGFATGATVHEATGHGVAVAFDCGNRLAVARAVRGRYPTARIVILADDDYTTVGNPGLTKAREAAAAGGVVAVPVFGPDRPEKATDFNDLPRWLAPTLFEAASRLPSPAKPATSTSSSVTTRLTPRSSISRA